MTIVFVSNYFNHHESPLCDELYAIEGVDFKFVQTVEMENARKQLGCGIDVARYPYVVLAYGSSRARQEAIDLCANADAVILGSAPYEFVAQRVASNRPTFYYAERLFRKGLWHMLSPITFVSVLRRFILPGRKSNFFLLAASGYTAYDTRRIGAFGGGRFRWGHFIDTQSKASKRDENECVKLLWVGRFLDWKHPIDALRVAKTLKDANLAFHLDMIGMGEEEAKLKAFIVDNKLGDCVALRGSLSAEEVRRYMEQADIYLFTSDFNEGWGAVLGEAMASGCAVVASHAAGATPFLARHNDNAMVYRYGDYAVFERYVLELVKSSELRRRLSESAVATMRRLWTPRVAAARFYEVCKAILAGQAPPAFADGPMSPAPILKNNWMK